MALFCSNRFLAAEQYDPSGDLFNFAPLSLFPAGMHPYSQAFAGSSGRSPRVIYLRNELRFCPDSADSTAGKMSAIKRAFFPKAVYAKEAGHKGVLDLSRAASRKRGLIIPSLRGGVGSFFYFLSRSVSRRFFFRLQKKGLAVNTESDLEMMEVLNSFLIISRGY